jgi:hypothetical protein
MEGHQMMVLAVVCYTFHLIQSRQGHDRRVPRGPILLMEWEANPRHAQAAIGCSMETFHELCKWVVQQRHRKLSYSGKISVEEKVAIFLNVVRTGAGFEAASTLFGRSTATISRLAKVYWKRIDLTCL